jgi:hypothetical protein
MLMLASGNPPKLPEGYSDLSADVMSEVTESMVCVAADDPRLDP